MNATAPTIATTTAPSRRPMRDWLPGWSLAPSWLLSLLIHAAMIAAAVKWLRVVDRPPVGFGDEMSRQVGIVLEGQGEAADTTPPAVSNAATNDPAVDDATTADAPNTNPLDDPSPVVPLEPPVAIAVPQPDSPTLGPGPARTRVESIPDARDLVRPSAVARPSAASLGAAPGAAFLGARDVGARVCFVVDCSGSMASNNAIRTAKAALASSLNGLEPTQQFQILFYNENLRMLELSGGAKAQMYFANDVNRSLAKQWISAAQPELGTDHLPAIKAALRLGPEVLFLLTDSDTSLDARERAEIRRLNGGRARIHCIEFGKGPESRVENFLHALARENGGTYRYHDVTKFGKP